MDQVPESPPRPNARAIGVVYLCYFLMAFLGGYLAQGLLVPGDAAMTANQLLTHEALYRSACAVSLLANLVYIAVTALFYRLFEPVNRNMSLLAAFLSLVGCAIQIFAGLLQLAPLLILKDSQFPHAFSPGQLQMVALLCLKLYSQAFSISLVIFAVYDLLLGYLIFTSAFLPRFIGAFMMCAGAGWLTFLWPPLSLALQPYVLPLGALAELVLMFWLIVKGVDLSKWHKGIGPDRRPKATGALAANE
jgi:hypothetical protein